MAEAKGFIAIIREEHDGSISSVVDDLFQKNNGEIPIIDLRDTLSAILKYSSILLIDESRVEEMQKTPCVEGVYRIKNGIIYQE